MDEPSPRPEDIYKRPPELFNHQKSIYGEASLSKKSPKSKKQDFFQSSLGPQAHRAKNPWQVKITCHIHDIMSTIGWIYMTQSQIL